MKRLNLAVEKDNHLCNNKQWMSVTQINRIGNAGKVKLDNDGNSRMSKHGRPQLRNGKGKDFDTQGCCP
jgi:hypothetical protein